MSGVGRKGMIRLVALVGVVLLVGLVFGRVVSYPYCWDDKSLIRDNPVLLSESPSRAWTADFWELNANPRVSGMYRPLVTLTYFAEAAVAGGSDPRLSHAVNLVLHVLATLLVALLALRILRKRWAARMEEGASGGMPEALAVLLGASIFALHPAQVEPVVNVAGRTDVLATIFLLAALHSRLRHATVLADIASAAAVFLALLCKESAVMALPLLLVFDWTFATPRPAGVGVWLRRAAGPLVATLGYFALRTAIFGSPLPSDLPVPAGTAEWTLWRGACSTASYLALLLWPGNLSPIHPPPVCGPLPGLALLGAGVGLLAVALVSVRRGGPREVLFGLVWFAGALVPVAGWLPVPARFSEAFLYLPLVGVAVAVVGGVGRRPRVLLGLLVLAALWAGLTTFRIPAWSSDLALWSEAVRAAPENARARLNYANALSAEGRGEEALQQALVASSLGGDDEEVVARAAYTSGNLLKAAGRFEEAQNAYLHALAVSEGGLHQAAVNLALLRADLGDLAGAEEAVNLALRAAPDDPRAALTKGVIAGRRGDLEAAERWFRRTLELAPGDPEAGRNLEMLKRLRAGGQGGP